MKYFVCLLFITVCNLSVTCASENEVIVNYSIEYEDGFIVKLPLRYKLVKTNKVILSDRDILDFASEEYSKADFMGTRTILGKHNNANIVAEYPCNDLCPVYTVRIIRYDVPLNRCDEVKGKIRSILVPVGIGSALVKFCVPYVLNENWEKYVK